MNQFIKIFKKVNGAKILKQYAYAHVLLYSIWVTLTLGFSKKSLEIVRLAVGNKIINRLRKKYSKFIREYRKQNDERIINLPHKHSNYVWICWLQGIENAPLIVKKCYNSLVDNLVDRDIVLLTEDNYKNWVSFPNHIQRKIDNGTITRTHMSDLLRLELLEHYGGTWIDATVYCSGKNIPSYILNSDFFIYQCMKPGLDGHASRTSSWFITSCTNHPIILLTKNLLYEYWETHNDMVDYFLVHDMIELAIESYPEEWMKVVPFSSSIPHILLLRLGESFDENVWNATKKMTPFHKLSWKFSDDQMDLFEQDGTYYTILIKQ